MVRIHHVPELTINRGTDDVAESTNPAGRPSRGAPRFVRDDVGWADWLDVRRRAYCAPPELIGALALELADWPDGARLVASDPEQKVDEWWIEGGESSPQPWLSLARALWVPPEELCELDPHSAWVREGLPAITTWFVESALEPGVSARCRSMLPSLRHIDLRRFAQAPKNLEAWISALGPIEQLTFGGPAVRARVIDRLIETHGTTLRSIDFIGLGAGTAGLRRLSRWSSGSPLRHMGLRDDTLDLSQLARVPLPWLDHLESLDLQRAGTIGRRPGWLRAPSLKLLSLNGIHLGDAARALLAQARLPKLQALRLASTGLDVEGLTTVMATSWSAGLICLDIRQNALPDEALEILDRGTAVTWCHLLLSGNRFSPDALSRFVERQGLERERHGVFVHRTTPQP